MDFSPIDRHENIALQFSGGKDSLACLHLLRPYWNRIHVVWCNTGDAFPETIAQMEEIKNLVPHFVEVKTDQPEQIKRCGPPADLVTTWDTPLGHSTRNSEHKVQLAFACCGENIWLPLHDKMLELGITLIIRGQRLDEWRTAPIKSGEVENGIEYFFPLQDWTREQVITYLEMNGIPLPEHYNFVDSSLDCMHCTGFLDEIEGTFGYLRQYHPAVITEIKRRLSSVTAAAKQEMDRINRIIED